jgi:hypothetical protein
MQQYRSANKMLCAYRSDAQRDRETASAMVRVPRNRCVSDDKLRLLKVTPPDPMQAGKDLHRLFDLGQSPGIGGR